MYSTMYEGDRVRDRVLALANANECECIGEIDLIR